jgi:hypothetical protein
LCSSVDEEDPSLSIDKKKCDPNIIKIYYMKPQATSGYIALHPSYNNKEELTPFLFSGKWMVSVHYWIQAL